MIKDSGTRRQFDSGAVRDMAEGKGRCDLLPLIEIADWLEEREIGTDLEGKRAGFVLRQFYTMLQGRDYSVRKECAYNLLDYAKVFMFGNQSNTIIEVSIHYEEGAKKYDERNWEKGIPLWCFVDSGIRHYLKWARGYNDEPHNRAFVWNVLGFMFTLTKEEFAE